jgi:phospholipase/lecithinase/hemolysin
MEKPGEYGIKNTADACAGRAIQNQDTTPCAAPDTYYYFHAGHPSMAVHKIVGGMLYQELIDQAKQ